VEADEQTCFLFIVWVQFGCKKWIGSTCFIVVNLFIVCVWKQNKLLSLNKRII